VLAVLAAVLLGYLLRQPAPLASIVSCNAVDPAGPRSPLNVLSCLHHDAEHARWEQPPCEAVRPVLETMTAPATFPGTRKLLAWRTHSDARGQFALDGQADALALLDACLSEGGHATAVVIYSYDTNWRRSLVVGLLPLLAFAWLGRTRVRIDVDDRAGTITATERRWGRGASVECRVDQVVDVVIDEDPSAFVPVRRLLIELRSGERLPLTQQRFAFTRRCHARGAARLREILASVRTSALSVDG
jgi:hypothetical protein